jgi:ankyrin repeat protein
MKNDWAFELIIGICTHLKKKETLTDNNEMHASQKCPDPKIVKVILDLLEDSAAPEAIAMCDNKGTTALHTAVKHQNQEIFLTMLKKLGDNAIDVIAKPDNEGNTVLHLATKCKEITLSIINVLNGKAAREMIATCNMENKTPLHLALERQSRQLSDPGHILIMLETLGNEAAEVIAKGDKKGRTLLHLAAEYPDLNIILNMLEKLGNKAADVIVSPNGENKTPLHLAIERQDSRIILNMLEKLGNKAADGINMCDAKDKTALHLAVKHQSSSTISIMLEKLGSNSAKGITIRDAKGKTPLHLTIEHQLPCTMLLILRALGARATQEATHAIKLPLGNQGSEQSKINLSFLRLWLKSRNSVLPQNLESQEKKIQQWLKLEELTAPSSPINVTQLKGAEKALQYLNETTDESLKEVTAQLLRERYPLSNLCRLIKSLPLNVSADLRALSDITSECNLLLMDDSPQKEALDSLPMTSNVAYVRVKDQLFFVNKTSKECNPLNITSNQFHRFDQAMNIERLCIGKPRRLSNTELSDITSITGHTPTSINTSYLRYEFALDALNLEQMNLGEPEIKALHYLFKERTNCVPLRVLQLQDIKIQEIVLNGEKEPDSNIFDKFLDALDLLKEQLEIFALNDAKLTYKLIEKLMKRLSNFSKLKQCELEGNQLRYGNLRRLFKHCSGPWLQSLSELSLSRNYIEYDQTSVEKDLPDVLEVSSLPSLTDAPHLRSIYLQGNLLLSKKRNRQWYKLLYSLLYESGCQKLTIGELLNSELEFLELKRQDTDDLYDLKFRLTRKDTRQEIMLKLKLREDEAKIISKLPIKHKKLKDTINQINDKSKNKETEIRKLKFNELLPDAKKDVCKKLLNYIANEGAPLKGLLYGHPVFKNKKLDRITSLLMPEVDITHDKWKIYLLAKRGKEHAVLAYEGLTKYHQRFFKAAHLYLEEDREDKEKTIKVSFYSSKEVIDYIDQLRGGYDITDFNATPAQVDSLHQDILNDIDHGMENNTYSKSRPANTASGHEITNCLAWAMDKIMPYVGPISVPKPLTYTPSTLVKSLNKSKAHINSNRLSQAPLHFLSSRSNMLSATSSSFFDGSDYNNGTGSPAYKGTAANIQEHEPEIIACSRERVPQIEPLENIQRDHQDAFKSQQQKLGTNLSDYQIIQNFSGSMKNQVGNSKCGYIRHSVIGDGECGYTAFGITRQKALELLTKDLNQIRTILQPAIHELLLTEEFYKYLIDNDYILSAISHERITQDLTQYGDNLTVLQGFLYYDVRDKKRDGGWSHPSTLQALAHIRDLGLRIWRLGEQEQLVPHRGPLYDYAKYAEGTVNQWIDLLFIDGNHFDRLQIISETEELEERIYPLNSSQSHFSQLSEDDEDKTKQELYKVTLNLPEVSSADTTNQKADKESENIKECKRSRPTELKNNVELQQAPHQSTNFFNDCQQVIVTRVQL